MHELKTQTKPSRNIDVKITSPRDISHRDCQNAKNTVLTEPLSSTSLTEVSF